jgi:hypothetical protein
MIHSIAILEDGIVNRVGICYLSISGFARRAILDARGGHL